MNESQDIRARSDLPQQMHKESTMGVQASQAQSSNKVPTTDKNQLATRTTTQNNDTLDPIISAAWRDRTCATLSAAFTSSPDAWIDSTSRHSLIPISGVIPFNGEPHLRQLVDDDAKSLLTPTHLHFIRNHGAVPHIKEEEYQLTIQTTQDEKGNPTTNHTWTLEKIRCLPRHSVIATLTCDGFRRKEVNMIKHTRGFHTGPGSTGTSVWSGVLLVDLLRESGVELNDQVIANLPFVCFGGADVLAHDRYGTSIPSWYARERVHEVLLAYEQNGKPLTPDHGAPLRLVIPGFVGGRSVKWLTDITLSKNESPSRYHWEDNRLYPPSVSLADLNSGKYFTQPEYTLYQMNVNSVITSPDHDSWFSLSPTTKPTALVVKGFAFAGGGRRIMRVEVSLDGGKIWQNAKLKYADKKEEEEKKPENRAEKKEEKEKAPPTKEAQPAREVKRLAAPASSPDLLSSLQSSALNFRPKCWSWCWWSLSVSAFNLLSSKEIVARAFDEALNTQPEHIEWNATGMMNNAWYRVKLQTYNTASESEHQPLRIRFLHPILPGSLMGGWMQSDASTLLSHPSHVHLPRAGPLIGIAAHKAHKLISAKEVAQHQTIDDCWIVMDHQVYDVSGYMRSHPGGSAALLSATKMQPSEVSKLFHSIHAADAFEITGRFLIGILVSDQLIEALTMYFGDTQQQAKAQEARGSDSVIPKKQPRYFTSLDPPNSSDDSASSTDVAKLSTPPSRSQSQGALVLNTPDRRDTLKQLHRRPNWHESPHPDTRRLGADKRTVKETGTIVVRDSTSNSSSTDNYLLHSTRWCPIRLTKIIQLTHDVKVFTFESSNEQAFQKIGLTTGQHLLLGATIENEFVVRPYTPIRPVASEEEESEDEAYDGDRTEINPLNLKDTIVERKSKAKSKEPAETRSKEKSASFDLLIKIYRAHGVAHGGKLTQWLDNLKVGDTQLRVKGPTGYVLYEGLGQFNIHGEPIQATEINLIGGGTGITPLYQLIRAMARRGFVTSDSSTSNDKKDSTTSSLSPTRRGSGLQVSLVYSNHSPTDILLRKELEALATKYPHNFRVTFVVSKLKRPEEHDTADKAGTSAMKDQSRAQVETSEWVKKGADDKKQEKRLVSGAEEEDEKKYDQDDRKKDERKKEEKASIAIAISSINPPITSSQPKSEISSPSTSHHDTNTPPPHVRVGHIDSFILSECIFPPSQDNLTFLCGPPTLVYASYNHLFELGFAEENIVEF